MWLALKLVPLWYQQQLKAHDNIQVPSCDLLENSYLCGISNNIVFSAFTSIGVVICLKIRTFVVSATTNWSKNWWIKMLWFAWKFVPLWYQQQRYATNIFTSTCCDLLENSYLCGISNNNRRRPRAFKRVVICLKIRTFVVSATTRSEI